MKATFIFFAIMLSATISAQTYMHKPRKYNKTRSSIPSAYRNYSSNNRSDVSCYDIIKYVKSKDYGTIYKSYSSDAIAKVTFYDLTVDFKTSWQSLKKASK